MVANYYEILGVSPSANESEIKAAFKALAKKYHPDKNAGNTIAEENFKKINSAYQILSDKTKRARYDFILAYQAQKKSQSGTFTHRSTQGPRTNRPTAKATPKASNSNNKKNIKYALIVITSFVIFGIVVLFFSRYMNRITAKERLQEAINMESKSKILMAIEYYSQAIEYDPGLTESYYRRAWLRYKYLRDTVGAQQDFINGISEASKADYRIYFEYAKFNFKNKKYDEGIININEAIKLNSNFDSLYLYKGEVYNYKLKNYNEAIKAYDKTLALNSKMSDALFGRAIAKQMNLKWKESLTDFDQLILSDPDMGAYYYYRSWSKRNLNDLEGSCSDLRSAVEKGFMEAQKDLEGLCD